MHYSDHPIQRHIFAEQLAWWSDAWNQRLAPPRLLSIVGGEPLLNPELERIIYLLRDKWPKSNLHLVTNGSLLTQQQLAGLPAWCVANNVTVTVSSHLPFEKMSKAYRQLIKWRQLYPSFRWNSELSLNNWVQLYQGGPDIHSMRPFTDNNQQESWNNCRNKKCVQLYDGKLWKCPPIAYLQLLKQKYKGTMSSTWDRYLEYQALGPDCTNEELNIFLAHLNGPELVCNMCPSRSIHIPHSGIFNERGFRNLDKS